MLDTNGTAAPDILTFDIEDWFHILGVPALEDAESWAARPSIVERETEAILETLAGRDARATFFVVGWIAERYPDLVRRIAEGGHELATHSHWHRLVSGLDAATFRDDLRRSIAAIEDAGGVRVRGFRAPSFSITPGSDWAFDILLEAGLDYDASLFPVARPNGGYPCPREPHRRDAPSGGGIAELPMSVMRLGPAAAGFSGGGYFRLAPAALIARGFRENAAAGRPTVVYLHPRDFTTDWPMETLPPAKRLLARVGCEGARGKLDRLLAERRFVGCAAYLDGRALAEPAA